MADTIFPPDHLDSMRNSIAGAIVLGQADTALDLADTVLAAAPEDVGAALLKAEVLEDVGRLDEARTVLEQLAAHRGDHALVWQRLGDVALGGGDSERAVEAYRQWQRLDGPTPDNETALAVAYVADLDLGRARTHAEAAHAAGADDASSVVERLAAIDDIADLESEAGWWLCRMGATERGRALLAGSLQRRDQAETRHRLGVALVFDDRADEALPHLRAAVVAEPDRAIWAAELGTALLMTGDVDAASACFDDVLAAAPDDHAGTIGAGRVAVQRGDPDRAIELADALLGRDPSDAEAWILRSQGHQAAGRPSHALVDAEHAIVSSPAERHVWAAAARAADVAGSDVLAHRYRARASIVLTGSLGLTEGDEVDDLTADIADELSELDRLVIADPLIRRIYQCRAMIADALFHPSRSVAYLDAAIERGIVDETTEVRCDRAALLLNAGDLDAAEAEFRSVLDAEPDAERARGGLAEVASRRPSPDAADPGDWAPTHRVPPTGLAAFDAHGTVDPPAAQLAAGLAVQLLGGSGSQAHLRCENGWECWVDATLLVPIRDSWVPSHVVPAGGLTARTAPSDQAAAAGDIAGGLQVEVLARVEAWAQVRFENEWVCWVAGDALDRLP